MKAFNIRQLKKNPSEALREAREAPVVVLKGDLPQALLVGLDLESLPESGAVRSALAASLYKEGTLTLGRAARVAAMSISDFITHLSRLGVPVIEGDEGEVRDDMETLERWLASS